MLDCYWKEPSMGIIIREHKSPSYAPRTWANAAEADVTIALAVDYTTAGERLTHKAAGDKKYLKLPLSYYWLENARTLFKRIPKHSLITLNIAGNGIYTLAKHGWTQEEVNVQIWCMIEQVHQFRPIGKIISGGQTGVDLAGGYAGWKLGIDTVLTLPKGFKQRHEDGIDRDHTEDEIRKQITG